MTFRYNMKRIHEAKRLGGYMVRTSTRTCRWRSWRIRRGGSWECVDRRKHTQPRSRSWLTGSWERCHGYDTDIGRRRRCRRASVDRSDTTVRDIGTRTMCAPNSKPPSDILVLDIISVLVLASFRTKRNLFHLVIVRPNCIKATILVIIWFFLNHCSFYYVVGSASVRI